ncbi:3-oxoacyl-[acyl-carrier-protein] synthase, KASII [hydrothermal vent metagenome]|uniref:Nodulation protein E n=1 Tax=hydrothermal vent metagenome TaxID=652676 RepID=A0A3B0TBC6_9ZZZZ
MRRVAITGLGAVTPLGLTARSAFAAACEGVNGIGPLQVADRDDYPHRLKQKIAGQIKDFDPGDTLPEAEKSLYDRSAQFSMMAAREAVAASGLVFDGELSTRSAVITGTGIGGIESIDNNAWRVYFEQKPRVHPFSVPRTMPSASASHISMAFNIQGPAFTISSACSSASHAIGEAYLMISHGRVDVAVTGGTEAPLSLGCLISWQALRVMSNTACRPFSKDRNGMVLGEGAGIVVLEEMEAAKRRGAEIHGELVGYGLSADAGDIVDPSPEGCARAIAQCVNAAGLNSEDIGYINAHGTGTIANDRTETRALKLVLGAGTENVWVSSTKSMHGHALGGTAAMEFVLATQAVRNGVLPPTINMTEPDPECDLRHVKNQAVEAKIDVALSNSFAFGGLNAVLAIRRIR